MSLRALQVELGVSHNVLHQRFRSKAGLWRAAVDHGFGGLLSGIDWEPDLDCAPLDRLLGLIRTFVLANESRPDLLRLVQTEGARASDRLDYLYENYVVVLEQIIRPTVDALTADGLLRPADWPSLYFLITSGGTALFGSPALAHLIEPDAAADPDASARHADFVADVIVAGLRSR
ncbi:TetR/AcrR family transcriptional regulator [Herbiconiux sp. VKM Ac-1786]|uniref:TetR/AcrR family transcriptional regulator n=1 Tax=Herbiconiux sp. VKM Ac-1786 TaxID=2783824 RepID=UPI00188A04EE|nr:TetR/AcrR family transcriptional regulator [Herbiconiux sp. VKM Ac-1786]